MLGLFFYVFLLFYHILPFHLVETNEDQLKSTDTCWNQQVQLNHHLFYLYSFIVWLNMARLH